MDAPTAAPYDALRDSDGPLYEVAPRVPKM